MAEEEEYEEFEEVPEELFTPDPDGDRQHGQFYTPRTGGPSTGPTETTPPPGPARRPTTPRTSGGTRMPRARRVLQFEEHPEEQRPQGATARPEQQQQQQQQQPRPSTSRQTQTTTTSRPPIQPILPPAITRPKMTSNPTMLQQHNDVTAARGYEAARDLAWKNHWEDIVTQTPATFTTPADLELWHAHNKAFFNAINPPPAELYPQDYLGNPVPQRGQTQLEAQYTTQLLRSNPTLPELKDTRAVRKFYRDLRKH